MYEHSTARQFAAEYDLRVCRARDSCGAHEGQDMGKGVATPEQGE
jgi:hypothetical protein